MKENPSTLILEYCDYNEDDIDGEIICKAALAGDFTAQRLLDEYTSYLAAGISSLVAIFRPEVIMLGGGIAHVLMPVMK